MYNDYASGSPRHPNQFKAIIGYSQKHTFLHAALFIVANDKGNSKLPATQKATLVALLSKRFISKQVLPVVIVLRD